MNLDVRDGIAIVLMVLVLFGIFFWQERRVFAAKCGHWTHLRATFEIYGKPTLLWVEVDEDGEVDYCLECLAKTSIRCAWCEQPIWAGEPVILSSTEVGKIPKKDAVPYAGDGNDPRGRYLGCIRPTCRGAEIFDVIWSPPGQIEQLPEPIVLRNV